MHPNHTQTQEADTHIVSSHLNVRDKISQANKTWCACVSVCTYTRQAFTHLDRESQRTRHARRVALTTVCDLQI